MAKTLSTILSLHDFEAAAKRRLPRPIYGYVAGAAEDGRSFASNGDSFDRYVLVPDVLRDVSQRHQRVGLFGQQYSSPFGIAPMGLLALSAYRGDIAMVKAAQETGVLSIISATSLIALEDCVAHNPQAWFQAYLPGDQPRIDALIDRVQRTGIQTLIVTVDTAVSANRENNVRAGFATPLKPTMRLLLDGLVRPGWVAGTLLKTVLKHGMPHFENSFAERGAPIISAKATRDFSARDHLNWSHLQAIRQRWSGKLLIKGVLSVADALMAKEQGMDGIIISNHGGRQLDAAAPALQVLPHISQALGAQYPILIDGSFRRGSDVLKALALGAHMVLLGRPFNFALALAGQAGVAHAIGLLQAEVQRNMGMLGVNCCAEIQRRHVSLASSYVV